MKKLFVLIFLLVSFFSISSIIFADTEGDIKMDYIIKGKYLIDLHRDNIEWLNETYENVILAKSQFSTGSDVRFVLDPIEEYLDETIIQFKRLFEQEPVEEVISGSGSGTTSTGESISVDEPLERSQFLELPDLIIKDIYFNTDEEFKGQYPLSVIVCNNGESIVNEYLSIKYQRVEKGFEQLIKTARNNITLSKNSCSKYNQDLFWITLEDVLTDSEKEVFDKSYSNPWSKRIQLRASVDSMKKIYEVDEDNNSFEKTLSLEVIQY